MPGLLSCLPQILCWSPKVSIFLHLSPVCHLHCLWPRRQRKLIIMTLQDRYACWTIIKLLVSTLTYVCLQCVECVSCGLWCHKVCVSDHHSTEDKGHWRCVTCTKCLNCKKTTPGQVRGMIKILDLAACSPSLWPHRVKAVAGMTTSPTVKTATSSRQKVRTCCGMFCEVSIDMVHHFI